MKLLTLTLTAAATASSIPAAALSGCSKSRACNSQSSGDVNNITITSDQRQRSFLLWIPSSYQSNTPTAAILSYHGGNDDATDQLELDKLTDPEFNTDSIVVYPQGINDFWQGDPNVDEGINDIQFTADIIDYLQGEYCIDPARIFATGKSDGGGFCNTLACDAKLSTRIAAFAPVSGAFYIDTSPCVPDTVDIPCDAGRTNVPFLEFHGGNDTTIHYQGGVRKEECLPAIPHFIQQWALRDGLGTDNVTEQLASNTVLYRFGKGANAGLVEHIYDSVIGHDWPSTAPNADNSRSGHHLASFNATPIILDFFKKHPLDTAALRKAF